MFSDYFHNLVFLPHHSIPPFVVVQFACLTERRRLSEELGNRCSRIMKSTQQSDWEKFVKNYKEFPEIGLAMDLSRLEFDADFFEHMEPRIQRAFSDMEALEKGAIANPDENRMVGHYWLRNPDLAPTKQIREEIISTVERVRQFAGSVHDGHIQGEFGKFTKVLIIGIGGSVLGPQFVARALGGPKNDKLKLFFFDNTDPDGMRLTLDEIGSELNRTLCLVISKSGGTKETRNGMIEAMSAYHSAGLEFCKYAVAITGAGSNLDALATKNEWLARFPMWDWIGGRTSELSSVGLLPAALQGIDIDMLMTGACACDTITRNRRVNDNPAAQLALSWFHAVRGCGQKSMVVLPYKDRLELFSKYLQQLIMESLGKENDKNGIQVNQGMSVFGNKGSTDQHSYIQQLRDGINNFFALFIEVSSDGVKTPVFVEETVTSGDFLSGFFLGTRQALSEGGRESVTITIKEISPFYLGALIALFERTVGLYASLINVNAYNQPGVEAGKIAAESIIQLQKLVIQELSKSGNDFFTAPQIAVRIGETVSIESVFKICQHLASNPHNLVVRQFNADSSRVTFKRVGQ